MLSWYAFHEVTWWKIEVVERVPEVASLSVVMQPVPVSSRPVSQFEPEVSAR